MGREGLGAGNQGKDCGMSHQSFRSFREQSAMVQTPNRLHFNELKRLLRTFRMILTGFFYYIRSCGKNLQERFDPSEASENAN